ncbi:MAG: hypothetical protein A3F10_00790 [Coxiella sp. RIFCSPHIGHO2_12_FULL_42_15]|nr:MAG: hypothetical protein A3F10_00790 [Coxiella sp. RIFCSPHIGHO2_12_FULL_42_15]
MINFQPFGRWLILPIAPIAPIAVAKKSMVVKRDGGAFNFLKVSQNRAIPRIVANAQNCIKDYLITY